MAEEPCLNYLDLGSSNKPTRMINEDGNISFDDRYLKRESYQQANVTKKTGRIEKSSGLVMRRLRRSRTVFTSEQVAELKYYFMQNSYVNTERAEQLAAKLSMGPGPVRVWFKNQRRKLKIKEAERQNLFPSENTVEARQFAPASMIMPSLTTSSTSSPSIAGVDMTFSYSPIYLDSSAYSVKPEPSYHSVKHEPGYQSVKHEPGYHSIKHETAYQWLQHLPPMTPNQMVYNSASPHHVPQLQSFHDAVINFNRLPYTIPSPASTNGDGNSMTVNSNNSDTSDYFSQMSPSSEIIEPHTPNSAHGEAESVFNGILDSLKTPKTEPPIETVYEEMTSAPEPNIKCEFETILEPYEMYQSSSPNSEQSHCLEFA